VHYVGNLKQVSVVGSVYFWTWGVPSRSVCTIKGGEGQSNTTEFTLFLGWVEMPCIV